LARSRCQRTLALLEDAAAPAAPALAAFLAPRATYVKTYFVPGGHQLGEQRQFKRPERLGFPSYETRLVAAMPLAPECHLRIAGRSTLLRSSSLKLAPGYQRRRLTKFSFAAAIKDSRPQVSRS